MRLPAPLFPLVAGSMFLACGALTGALNSSKGSCDWTMASPSLRMNECQDTVSNVTFVGQQKATCSATGGTWSSQLCPRSQMLAGCYTKTPEGSEFTMWYRADPDGGYPSGVLNTPDDVAKQCEKNATLVMP